MKKVLLILTLLGLKTFAFSQTADSISMLPGNALDVYYNLSTGHVDTVRNNNWHIAFAMRKAVPPMQTAQAASILINEGRNVEIFKSSKLISQWSSFDTAGWMTWPTFFNSDSSWDIGALNVDRNLTNPFDYGWGQYSQTSHDVVGTHIWLIAITTSPNPADPKTLKRLAIQKISFDTLWIFTLSNVDGSDSTTLTIKKSNFNNKLFAYVNVLSKTVIDREPQMGTWDLLFTKYKSLVTLYGQTLMYPVTGALHNPALVTAKLAAPLASTTVPANTLTFKPNIRTIGWDWKIITVTPGAWPIKDSLAYFVKTGPYSYYRIAFKEYFANSSSQYIKFNKTPFTNLTGNNNLSKSEGSLTVFPNPASHMVSVEAIFDRKVNQLNVRIFDMTGQEVMKQNYSNVSGLFSAQLNINQLGSGLYFISLEADGSAFTQKLILE